MNHRSATGLPSDSTLAEETVMKVQTRQRALRAALCIVPSALFAVGAATAQPVHTTVSADRGRVTISYSIQLEGTAGQDARIEVPVSASASRSDSVASACSTPSHAESKASKLIVTCSLNEASSTLTVHVTDNEAAVVIDSRQTVVITVGDKRREVPNVQVLKAADEDGRVQAVVGGAFAYLQDDYTDFTIKNDTLLVQNDSRYRPTLLAGALLRMFAVKSHDVGLHASTQFAAGGAALDGFSLGVGYALNKRAHVTMGLLLRKGRELSPGFLRAVSTATGAAASASPLAPYREFDASSKQVSVLDGLPLKTGDKAIFPGDPIIDSYNVSVYLGVVVPVGISSLLGGKSKKEEEK
jgi:hypothetical protein